MPGRDDHDNLPPIPDGGLAESMPDWLRRPPAWRTLRDSEVVQTRPAETATLPEPDTSDIDPRAFVSDDDLPAWLRDLGHARRVAATPGDDDALAPEAEPAREPSPEPVAPAEAPEERPPSRFVPRQLDVNPPPATGRAPRPAALTAQPPEGAPWWRGTIAVAVLAVLLLLAIVAIVVLAVA